MSSKHSKLLVIEASAVSKCYQSYRKPIHRLWQSLWSKKKFYQEFWALRGVNLEVERGETVGIVGRNGSGKSTLLQIIAGILKPTEGVCATRGRVSALLELGAGFNPDFTGMENARLNASIMGLTRDEFHQKLPDIVEFCGLGDFLQRPVKTYSSGMYVRLAFAVAINMNPDILIIDEALAVGDVRFQRKCFRRIEEIKAAGVSILFVTHSTDSVINYCDRAIMLEQGQVIEEGSPKEVVQAYLESMFASDVEIVDDKLLPTAAIKDGFDVTQDHCPRASAYNVNEHRWGDQRAKICNYELTVDGEPSNGIVESGDLLQICAYVYFQESVTDLIYGITVKTADGNAIYGTNSRLLDNLATEQSRGDLICIRCSLNINLLGGDYFISLGVAQDHSDKDNIAIDRRYDLIHLHVANTPKAFGTAALEGTLDVDEAP